MPLCRGLACPDIWPHIFAGHSLNVHYKQAGLDGISLKSFDRALFVTSLVKLGKLLDASGIKHDQGVFYLCAASAKTIGGAQCTRTISTSQSLNPPLCWSNIQVGRKMGSRRV